MSLELSPFKSSPSRIVGEAATRLENATHRMPLGVPFLDAALGGLSRHDLLLVGGYPGGGKTELVNIIAQSCAMEGKRVHVFALEAEPDEFERRIKFRLLSQRFFTDPDRKYSTTEINYALWMRGKLEGELERYYDSVNREIQEKFSNLYTCYRDREFNLGHLHRALLSIQNSTDLVIVDHLHYIDHDDENENRAQTEIVKKVRDMALEMGNPVILVAHVRKVDRRTSPLVPSLSDFMGSSNIGKIATKAIMLAPANVVGNSPHTFGTYMLAAKCREDGSVMRYLGLTCFNYHSSQYEKKFKVSRYYEGIQEFEEIVNPEEKPYWAKDGYRP